MPAPAPSPTLRYCPDPFSRRRRRTRVVRVGRIAVGGDHPIRLQSMTTTDTLDTQATVAQTLRMVEAGCEIVRITTPTVNDARNLGRIKEELLRRGCDVPLVADVHFSPASALEAAQWADKVRINPGNFVDTKRFAVKEYSDAEYDAETRRVEAAVAPLIGKLKSRGRALRIGVNHGSLSDRILNRYGDTPLGMVESALEYVRACETLGYRDIILSMKSSNPKVMVAAYRLLAARMDELGMDYPFHLGVTEAGGGEDGRVKSAMGIGGLLEDGIGDTIRVSLTEDPEFEIPVCRALAQRFQPGAPGANEAAVQGPGTGPSYCLDPFSYSRRPSDSVRVGPFRVGGRHPVRLATPWDEATGKQLLAFLEEQLQASQALEPEIVARRLDSPEDLAALKRLRGELTGQTSRLAFLGRARNLESAREALADLDLAAWSGFHEAPPAERQGFLEALRAHGIPLLIETPEVRSALAAESECRSAGVSCLVSLRPARPPSVHDYRLLAARLASAGSAAPILLQAGGPAPAGEAPGPAGEEALVLEASLLVGSLLCDGIGDAVSLESPLGPRRTLRLAYNILQAAGVRITKAEFVSCPSCGRTLFDLQSTTERIQAMTGHLKGVKIAIMGCIVNGPGEMADADFGYVGGAPDRINLYVGKECVRKGVPAAEADMALVELIKAHGKWADRPEGG